LLDRCHDGFVIAADFNRLIIVVGVVKDIGIGMKTIDRVGARLTFHITTAEDV
jgi:hypothetical protein